jgi:hypothetical protein
MPRTSSVMPAVCRTGAGVEASDSETELFVCITKAALFVCCYVGNSCSSWLFPFKEGIICMPKEL